MHTAVSEVSNALLYPVFFVPLISIGVNQERDTIEWIDFVVVKQKLTKFLGGGWPRLCMRLAP